MRLDRLRIGSFRDGRDLVIEFGGRPAADPALSFLVGPNGAGKSRVLEAIGRIFSHLSEGILPGLDFDLEYTLGNSRILITTKPPALEPPGPPPRLEQIDGWLLIAPAGDAGWGLRHVQERWPTDLDQILPHRVLGLSSGPTSRLDWALRQSLRESAGEGGQAPDSPAEKVVEARCVPLLGDELGLAVLALLGHPLTRLEQDDHRDRLLLERTGLEVRSSLRAFSFVVPPDWRRSLAGAQHPLFEQFLAQASRRIALEAAADSEEAEVADRKHRAVFQLDDRLREWIATGAHTPYVWFNQLLVWLKAGALEEVRLVLTRKDHHGLLLDHDFSDGEFLFAGRFGLLQLLKGQSDILVLFDEPETHFNDRWKVELIHDLERVLEGARAQVVIATHSDLTISDADRVDVHVIDPGSGDDATERPRQPPVSPLAADRGEITRQVFGAEAGSGMRGIEIVDEALASRHPKRLREALDRVGPGFHRFRLEYALRMYEEDGDDS